MYYILYNYTIGKNSGEECADVALQLFCLIHKVYLEEQHLSLPVKVQCATFHY